MGPKRSTRFCQCRSRSLLTNQYERFSQYGDSHQDQRHHLPAGAGDELAHRFAARAGAVDGAEGFEGFELLKPTDDRDQWLVLTRWRDDESFQAWVESPSFAEGHRSAVERAGGDAPKPVSTHSEVWSYEIAGGSQP